MEGKEIQELLEPGCSLLRHYKDTLTGKRWVVYEHPTLGRMRQEIIFRLSGVAFPHEGRIYPAPPTH